MLYLCFVWFLYVHFSVALPNEFGHISANNDEFTVLLSKRALSLLFTDSHFSHFAHNTFTRHDAAAAEMAESSLLPELKKWYEKCENHQNQCDLKFTTHACVRARLLCSHFNSSTKSTKVMRRKMCLCVSTRWFSFFPCVSQLSHFPLLPESES